ncbi:MAG: type II toxin-antitoxin system prevent-host-death family antitoxin [Terracidiphilus sp.]|jgi:prevent-host-death family protein
MLQIGAFEAKNTFGSLLDRVEAGEEILITRHGKPAARLAPVSKISDADRARAHAALARMTQRAQEIKLGPFDWEEWKAYRDEGRR